MGDAAGLIRLGVVGTRAEEVRDRLADRRVELVGVPASVDAFELADIDAVVVADEAPNEWYRRLREASETQPIVVVQLVPESPGPDRIDDPYGAVVGLEGSVVPAGLVVARARQLARQPGSGADLDRVTIDTAEALHRERPRPFYLLWGLAALAYGVGDTVTTVYGIEAAGLAEQNPLVDAALETVGLAGFVALKLVVFLGLLAISIQASRVRNHRGYYWPPAALVVVGVALTAWNGWLILG